MYHHQQQQPPSFTYLSQQPQSTNPNTYLSFSQPSSLVSELVLHPPGTDPYANSGPYPLTHVGIGSQTQLYQDPNVGSQSWVTSQPDPIRYDAASVVSTSLNSSSNSNWANQPLVNDVTRSTPMQSKVNQILRCEVCNIDCNSIVVFEKHMSGKKHQKNLQLQNNHMAATLLKTSNTINNICLPGQMGMGQQIIHGASSVATNQELEIKRQKLLIGGAAVDSVRFCTICNVACNSQEVFAKHLAGKKHAAQAGLISLNGIGPYVAAIRAHSNSTWNKCPKKIKVVQSAWCDVCKINCSSNDVYAKHLVGKKHQKNLEKLEKSNNGTSDPASGAAPAATIPIIGPVENPEAKKSYGVDSQKSQKRAAESQAPAEDLETKKRKVVEGGAAASAVRVCTICNVVCNSRTVFDSHLAGQKHASMVKKQAEARTTVTASQLVTVL